MLARDIYRSNNTVQQAKKKQLKVDRDFKKLKDESDVFRFEMIPTRTRKTRIEMSFYISKRRSRMHLERTFYMSLFLLLCSSTTIVGIKESSSLTAAALTSSSSSGNSNSKTSSLRSSKMGPHINVSTQQFPSSDIVAQFSLPAAVGSGGSVASGDISGQGDSVATSTTSTTTFNTSRPPLSTATSFQYSNYFTHLAYDYKQNVFYASATNKILQLNENLRVLSQALTGPKHDSPQCHASGCPEDVETTQVNNHNKILIVNYAQGDGILIACGSIRQGKFI